MVGYVPHGRLSVPAPAVPVVDTVGAGDAFCGGLLAHLWRQGITDRAALAALDGEGWLRAMTVAVAVAALTCTRAGADPPWAYDLAARAERRPLRCTCCSPPRAGAGRPGGRPRRRRGRAGVRAAGPGRRRHGRPARLRRPAAGGGRGGRRLDVPAVGRSGRRPPRDHRRRRADHARAGASPASVLIPTSQPDGRGWPDNDRRFLAFSTAVAALAALERPDVLHLNDWHTSAALAFLYPRPPTVLTIHNLAYQGQTNSGWLHGFPHHPEAFVRHGDCNPLVGGIRLADSVDRRQPDLREGDPHRCVGLRPPARPAGEGGPAGRHLERDRHRGVGPGSRPSPPDRLRLARPGRQGRRPRRRPRRDGPARPGLAAARRGVAAGRAEGRRPAAARARPAWTGSRPRWRCWATAIRCWPTRWRQRPRRRPRRVAFRRGYDDGAGPPALRRRRPAGHAQPLRALWPRPDASHALRDHPGRHGCGRPARHRHRRRRAALRGHGHRSPARPSALGAARRPPPRRARPCAPRHGARPCNAGA